MIHVSRREVCRQEGPTAELQSVHTYLIAGTYLIRTYDVYIRGILRMVTDQLGAGNHPARNPQLRNRAGQFHRWHFFIKLTGTAPSSRMTRPSLCL